MVFYYLLITVNLNFFHSWPGNALYLNRVVPGCDFLSLSGFHSNLTCHSKWDCCAPEVMIHSLVLATSNYYNAVPRGLFRHSFTLHKGLTFGEKESALSYCSLKLCTDVFGKVLRNLWATIYFPHNQTYCKPLLKEPFSGLWRNYLLISILWKQVNDKST